MHTDKEKQIQDIRFKSGILPETLDLKKRIPKLDAVFPGWRGKEQGSEFTAVIPVKSIIGSATRAEDYYEDWTPVKPDKKWDMLVDAVSENKRLDELAPARPIHLLKTGDRYWVAMDGHRRVSLAKITGVDQLKCVVNEINKLD